MIRASGLGQFETKKIIATQRLGASTDTVAGGVYQVDTAGNATESTDPDSNAVSVIAVNTSTNKLLVVADGVYADNTPGVYTLVGLIDVLVDGGTNDVAEGDSLCAVNAATSLVKQMTSGGTQLQVACGVAFEAYTSGTAALKKVLFDGRIWRSNNAQS